MSRLKALQIRLFFLIFALPISVSSQDYDGSSNPLLLITVPKSGSHMILKALHLLTGATALWHTADDYDSLHLSEKQFLYTHFCVPCSLEENYTQISGIKKIINIRDLRDVCISMVHHINKSPWPGMSGEQRKLFKTLSFDEQLLFIINYDYDLEEVAGFAPNALQVSIVKIAEQLERYCQQPDYLICRYENLVGSKGGGSQEAQIREVKRIASYLDLTISKKCLEGIASKLYGNTFDPFGKNGFENYKSTFRQGKINDWKALFKEQHKEAFKIKMNKALIALGYETNENW